MLQLFAKKINFLCYNLSNKYPKRCVFGQLFVFTFLLLCSCNGEHSGKNRLEKIKLVQPIESHTEEAIQMGADSVYICKSVGVKVYHLNKKCSRLLRCKNEITVKTIATATASGHTLCSYELKPNILITE